MSTRLESEQNEISRLETIGWENHSWKYLSLIGVEYSKDSIRCSSVKKSKVYCADWEKHQKISQEEFYLCRCSSTFPVEQKTMKQNVWQTPNSYLCTREDLEKDSGRLLVLVLRKSGTLWKRIVHKEFGTIWRKRCCWNSPKADVQFSVLRAHCPEVDSKANNMENCRYTMQPIWKRLRLFRIFVSANQLSPYGAVAEICEEYESLHKRTERPIVMGQSSSSLLLSAIKTEVLLDCDDVARKDLLLQQFGERIKKFSQQDKSSKFCTDVGFLNVVEIGQYFMTKDTEEFSHFNTVACREYTLPRDDGASQPKRMDQGKHQNWSRIGSCNLLLAR